MYNTSEVAKQLGIHPNTVRWYEELGYMPPVKRKENGYRVYTDIHLEQLKLVRYALRCEILQSGLRKKALEIIMLSASGSYNEALEKTHIYQSLIQAEKIKAEEAVELIHFMLNRTNHEEAELSLTRNDTAKRLGVSIDALRNWERNGLVEVPRKVNGYRIYTNREIKMLKIVRVLRRANYSTMSILRMLSHLQSNTAGDLKTIIDTPGPEEDIVYVTDKLITSLSEALLDAAQMIMQIKTLQYITRL